MANHSDRLHAVKITPAMERLFRERRIYTKPRAGGRWAIGDEIYFHAEAAIEPYSHIFAGQYLPRSIGVFSYMHSACDGAMEIGRYCAIAAHVAVMGSQHPIRWATISPFSYEARPLQGIPAYLEDVDGRLAMHDFDQGSQRVSIGHDVWIGQNVLIKRNLTIGTGAVVAAGSIVTRDVPPYAIVGGNPARLIRYRFAEPLIEQMLQSEWWNYAPDALQPLDVREPAQFLDRLDAAIADGLQPLMLEPLTGTQMIAAGEIIV